MLASLLFILQLGTLSLAGVQELYWNITYVEDANPDGLYCRRVIGVNGKWPPPPIDISTTDSLLLHATNSLNVPTTLHHHGMYFNSTSWMDGAAFVSQCGIPPGETFDYVVPINSSGQRGTYWIHGHSSGQYVDGLRAPLLLHPQNECYDYEGDFTVILSDWYHKQHDALLKEYISKENPSGMEPVPNSALMYFAQGSSYLPSIPGTSPSPVTSTVGFNENATLHFKPGKTYRLRIINMSAFSAFFFWIDGHDMRIIEADGTDVKECPVSMVSIAVAQRYSVLVRARNDSHSNWMIHADMDTTMFASVPQALKSNITSSITYTAGKSVTDLGPAPIYHTIDDMKLVPLDELPLVKASRTIDLVAVFETMSDGTNRAMLNGHVYNPPVVPAIVSVLTLGDNATVQEAYGPTSFVIDHNDGISVCIWNNDTGPHPFHLHGHQFQIVHRTTQYDSTDPTLNPSQIEEQLNPMRRDVVVVGPGKLVELRFIADNAGAWFLHCHINWHLEAGLAVQFIEAPLVAQQRAVGRVPPSLFEQCAAQGIPQSGNAAGHASITDLSGLPLGPWPPQA